eukprot:10480806-Lingulodinium_polyedra.AAC.1
MPKAKAPPASSKSKASKRTLSLGRREAQRGDFPTLIPFHAGPITMFTVSTKTKEGEEGWVKCTSCDKWLGG